ncbi:MAG: DUF1549 domain-containing protein [Opitutus sp.]|nr:DUF1549 domain-containing protein [Opitutus sp.]
MRKAKLELGASRSTTAPPIPRNLLQEVYAPSASGKAGEIPAFNSAVFVGQWRRIGSDEPVLPTGSIPRKTALIVLAKLGAVSFSLVLLVSIAQSAPVDYGRDVRPILSDKCYHCHGPDESGRKAKLRFDTKEGAFRLKDGAAVIIPGKSAESEIIFRVSSTDTEEMMPPPEAKLARLTPAEIDILKRWIDEGAPYQTHWSFTPLAAVVLPAEPAKLPADVTARSPIDRVVFAGLAARKLAPQPPADRATLMRRVSFDLTGLPPTPAETDAFLKDNDPKAYERLVDRLLSSPRYGERMAVDWLDVARYADSYGFQVDHERDMWPWRDWVIKAFNENLPWDKFVTWQLAGDLLPKATSEQRLATAFNRLHAMESEGGSVEEEYRINYVNDRVTTFGTAFLGLTLECCRCHDHKFDPLAQKEFYSLAAFFQNIDEAGLYSFFTPSAPTPAMWVPDATHEEKFVAATRAVKSAEEKLAALRETRRAAFATWLDKKPALPAAVSGELARFDFDHRATGVVPAPEAAGENPAAVLDAAAGAAEKAEKRGRFASSINAADVATTPKENESVPGRSGLAVKLTGDHPINTTLGNFRRHEPFSISVWIQTPDVKKRAVVLHRSRAWTDAASRGYELLIEDGRLKWSLIHFWPGDAISIRANDPVPVGEWVHVTVTNDGSSRAAGLRLFVNGRPMRTEVIRDNLTKDITGGGGDTIVLGERFRDRGFKGGLVDDLRVFGRALTELEARAVFSGETLAGLFPPNRSALAGAERERWFDYFLANHDESHRQQQCAVADARAAQTRLADEAKDIMVMRELSQPKKAYVLKRGEYSQHGEEVGPGTPAALPPFPKDQPRNRLGLARWLTDSQHPLLARVTVNRFWQATFGLGLVKTVDDFGSQGDRAEYPALLDWLAGEFIRSGWDVKALLKTIVLSHTYRQRSFATPEVMTDDPENISLARGPRYRLPAEMIRDNALAVSGLLVEKIGGPPVYTYDIPESFKPAPAGKGEALYRRSVYTYWRRNGPAPALEAFDVPKRVVCVARRDTTNTPLHAFVLLNGPQFVEAARVLAEKLHRECGGKREEIVEQAFRRIACRVPDAVERKIVGRLFDEQLAWYRDHAEEATAYVAIGDTPRDATLPAAEIAAVAALINTLMNHDAFVVKR